MCHEESALVIMKRLPVKCGKERELPDLLAAFGQNVFLLLLNFTLVFRLLSYCSQSTELKRLRVYVC